MCWLCEGKSERKVIGYVDDTVLWLGKRKTGEVKFWSTSEYGIDCNFYKPNFCPECGKDLGETHTTNPKRYNYGVCNGHFYEIYHHGNYFSAWIIDVVPTDVTENGIAQFEDDHVNEGDSFCGTLKEVVEYIYNLLVAKDN